MGRSLLLFVFVIAAFFQLSARQQPEVKKGVVSGNKVGTTTIYLMRHAEKETADPKDQDPVLTSAGLKRADDLKVLLKDENIDAFFSTPYKRTQQTLAPLAKGRPIQFYDAHDFESLRSRVMKDFRGKTLVVVGHSNTLLPLIEAFGAKKPAIQIGDSDYDNLFKIKISPKGKATVQTLKYGALTS